MSLAVNYCETLYVNKELLPLETIEKNIIKKYRKDLWSKFTKAVRDFELIEEGDKVAVAISGGKDSVLMAKIFQIFHRYSKIEFDVEYVAMDPGYHKDIRKLLEKNCDYLQIPVKIFDTDVFEVADKISSDYPCYMCAKMRRGALYNIATSLGCSKLALGHHFDDVIETVMLNIMYAGSYKTMMPKIKAENFENMELIRPMYYMREDAIIKHTQNSGINMLNCACMVAAKKTGSKRYEIKNLIKELKKTNPLVEKSIFSSTKNVYMDCVLGYNHKGKKINFLEEY